MKRQTFIEITAPNGAIYQAMRSSAPHSDIWTVCYPEGQFDVAGTISEVRTVIKGAMHLRERTDCHNCGGDGYSMEGGDCPACHGTGLEQPTDRFSEVAGG